MQSHLLILPAHILETSSILHVTLLVFLRLEGVKHPLQSRENGRVVHILYVFSVWIISISSNIVPVILLAFERFEVFRYSKIFMLQCFGTFPVISIVIMWRSLLKIAKASSKNFPPKSDIVFQSRKDLSQRRIVKVVHRLVIALLFCYIPFLFWKQYFYSIILTRVPHYSYTTTVSFAINFDNHIFQCNITEYKNSEISFFVLYYLGSNNWRMDKYVIFS